VTPEEGAFIMNMGVLLHEIHEYQQALHYYNQAFKLMHNHPQLLQNIAACIQAIKIGNEEHKNVT
jgi:Flp pilus assembly protein TadD